METEIAKFERMKEKTVVDPIQLIQKLSEKTFSVKFTKVIAESFQKEPDQNMFGVINAFTRAAQTLDYSNRVAVEKFAGNLIESRV